MTDRLGAIRTILSPTSPLDVKHTVSALWKAAKGDWTGVGRIYAKQNLENLARKTVESACERIGNLSANYEGLQKLLAAARNSHAHEANKADSYWRIALFDAAWKEAIGAQKLDTRIGGRGEKVPQATKLAQGELRDCARKDEWSGLDEAIHRLATYGYGTELEDSGFQMDRSENGSAVENDLVPQLLFPAWSAAGRGTTFRKWDADSKTFAPPEQTTVLDGFRVFKGDGTVGAVHMDAMGHTAPEDIIKAVNAGGPRLQAVLASTVEDYMRSTEAPTILGAEDHAAPIVFFDYDQRGARAFWRARMNKSEFSEIERTYGEGAPPGLADLLRHVCEALHPTPQERGIGGCRDMFARAWTMELCA
jgi:hypothetical protein